MSKRRDKSPFDDAAIREMAHALAVAMMRPKNDFTTMFSPTVKLDTSLIDDRRNKPVKLRARALAKQRRIILAKRGAFAGNNKLERPGPRQHDFRDAFAGDSRLERPAPHGPDVQYVGKGDAGSRHSRRVIATKPGEVLPSTRPKPKKKQKPRFNQGRHDG